MISSIYILVASGAIALASPLLEVRTVASLNQAAFDEAQQRDATATRAFASTSIKTGDGQCVFVDPLSGSFRANGNPVEVAACDNSKGQQWDIITKGKHNDKDGTMLVVNTLTQACLSFDARRANKVHMFSCGGRADGSGEVTDSQLFSFSGGSGPLALQPQNSEGNCFAVAAGNVLDLVPCKAGDSKQSFSFAGAGSIAASATSPPAAPSIAVQALPVSAAPQGGCTSVTFVTVTRTVEVSTPNAQNAPADATVALVAPGNPPPPANSPPAANTTPKPEAPNANPVSPVPVSRAGGTLNPSAAAEAHRRDDTATRAFSGVSLKSSDGQCLFVDPTAGDFRQNLIPVQVKPCTGSANEKFDVITAGKHNNAKDSAIIVSSLTQGCLNFDDRRAAGDTVMMFSCGGRGDGGGDTTSSQVFPFTGGNAIVLAPANSNGGVCLAPKGGKLDQAACNGGAGQTFTIS